MKKNFKKILMLIFILNAFILTSCEEGHIHEFSKEWNKNEEYHYHQCMGKDCLEVADKEKHIWNEGEITTEATKEEMGEKTYTSTVCNATKGEKIEFDGMTEEKWNNIVKLSSFDNVTFELDAIGIEGVSSTSSIVKIAGNKCLIDDEIGHEVEINNVKELFIKTMLMLVNNFSDFTYDEENDLFVANKTISYVLENMMIADVDGNNTSIGDVIITAENAKVELDENMKIYKITCHMTQDFYMYNMPQKFVIDVKFTFTDYGTTVVE